MGTYIHYSLGDAEGIKDTVFENLPNLIECMDRCKINYPEEFDQVIYNGALKLFDLGEAALEVTNEDDANLIDRVVDELVFYEDLATVTEISFTLFEGFQAPMMKVWRYASELEDVYPNCSAYLARRYKEILFEGMSLARLENHKYASSDGVYKVSWVAPKEFPDLITELEAIIPSLKKGDEQHDGVYYFYNVLCYAMKKQRALVVEIA